MKAIYFYVGCSHVDDATADPGAVPTINLNQIGRIHNLDSS